MNDDAELLRRSVDAPELFEGIFTRHYDAILRYARQRVGHSLGEDVASRTFLIAFEHRDRYDPRRSSARPWLHGIATNLIRHHYRDEKTHLTALSHLPIDPDLDDVDDPAHLDAERLRPALLAGLSDLRPADREVFVLFAVAELTYEEVAQALEIPIGTVRSRIHRARHRLREQMDASRASKDGATRGND